MLAYASCHSTRSSMSRNKPLIRLFCLEMSPSASNRLITVADSISTSSLLVDYQQCKLFPFPLVAEVSRVLLLTYPHTSTASTDARGAICGTHYGPLWVLRKFRHHAGKTPCLGDPAFSAEVRSDVLQASRSSCISLVQGSVSVDG